MEENEKLENNDIKESKGSFWNSAKKTIFNKFYIEFISYYIVLILGLILSSVAYTNSIKNIQIIGGFIVLIVVSILMYILGYLIARKRKGLNKYFSAFCIAIIILFIYIIDNLFNCSDSKAFILNFIHNIDYMILSLHSIIFKWLEICLQKNIANEIFLIYMPFILFLGMRRNRINEIKVIKKKKERELVK